MGAVVKQILSAILPKLGEIAALLLQLLGLLQEQNRDTRLDDILADTQNTVSGLANAYSGLVAIRTAIDGLQTSVNAANTAIGALNDPTTAAIANAVWNWADPYSHEAARVMLERVHFQSYLLADYTRKPYLHQACLALEGGSTSVDIGDVPFDNPTLHPENILEGDTLLTWLTREAPGYTWQRRTDEVGNLYYTASETPGFNWICTLTQADFDTIQRDKYPPDRGNMPVQVASGIEGAYDYSGTYRRYWVHLSTIPSFAGKRTGTPPLYEVNSRADQLGWAMFGNDQAWYQWQLLTWEDHILVSQHTAPTRFHLELKPGVVADLYRVS